MRQLVPYKWEMLALLWFAFLFNQADRAVFGFVMPLIQADLGLSDVQLGLVVSTFHLFYAVLAPLSGYVGDIVRRSRVVVASITTWSLATLLTGCSANVVHLILFRGASLGLGEAFYLPSATGLIGQYHEKTRAFAMSIHQTALYFGMVGSGAMAGYLGDHLGWRYAFYVFGGAGLLWAGLLLLRLKDADQTNTCTAGLPNASAEPAPSAPARIPLGEVIRAIARRRSVLMLCLMFGCLVFVNVGYITWMPYLLHEKFNFSLAQAGFSSMFYHVVAAFLGVLLGGKLSDACAKRWSKGRMMIEGIGFLMTAPFLYLMGTTESPVLCFVGLAGFGLFRGICDSTLFAALFDVIEPKYRSSSMGIVISCALVAGSLSPVALGWIKSTAGLSLGIALLSTAALLGAAITFLTLVAFFDRDYVGTAGENES